MMKGEKAKNFKGTIRRLLAFMGSYRISLVVIFLFAIASTLFNVAGPKILGRATTSLYQGVLAAYSGTGGIDFTAIARILLLALALYGASSFFSAFMGWKMARISTDISYRFRREISEKINRIPQGFYDKTTHGEVLSRITNDVDTINQTLSQSLTQMITSLVTVAGILVMMLSINRLMTLTAMLIIPASMALVQVIVKHSQKHFKEQQAVLGNLNGHIEEMYAGHTVMKAFNGEEKSIETFEALNGRLYNSAWKSQFLSGLMMPLMRFVGNLGYVAVTILGSWMVAVNRISLWDVQAFIQYVRNFTHPIMAIANISNVLQQTAAAAERVFEFLDEPEESADPPEIFRLDSLDGHVEFRDVRFGYHPENPVIHNFSASARPGQKIAIVGPTGAGKTTMVKLLMRFYDVDSGAILVDGRDIRGFSRAGLRSHFAMVLQDTWLYNSSIMENIRYGRADASDEEVYRAARAAHADHFIHTLPEGYQMEINEELTNISQGQKQLLTIARAILADPRILILDEATSSVDTRTEILIQKAMDNLMQNRTSFVIAHRLSTIRNADLILVMNEGDIVEQGTHEELMNRSGFYADLYASQFEPENVEAG